jgi:hypothetical protein
MAGSAFWVGLYCSSHRMMAQKTSVSMAIRPAHPHDETLGSCLLCRLVVKRSHCQAGSAPQPAAAGGKGLPAWHRCTGQGGVLFLVKAGRLAGAWEQAEYRATTQPKLPGIPRHRGPPTWGGETLQWTRGVAGSLHKTAHR